MTPRQHQVLDRAFWAVVALIAAITISAARPLQIWEMMK